MCRILVRGDFVNETDSEIAPHPFGDTTRRSFH